MLGRPETMCAAGWEPPADGPEDLGEWVWAGAPGRRDSGDWPVEIEIVWSVR